ncbi:MAG: ribosome hibernation-promoting factor, HPF/YfiA family [Planctomycetia bacterium]
MQITITGRHLGVTEAMKAYARTKVEKLLRFFDRTTQAAVTMDVQHQDHEVEIVLDVARGARLVGKASAPDMYAAVDLAEHKLAMQLRKAKDRRRDHHRGERARGEAGAPAAGAPGRAAGDEGLSTYEDVIERLRRGE